jgi:hypothetical protein
VSSIFTISRAFYTLAMEQAKERSRLLQLAYARGDCTSAVASLSTSSSDEAAEEKQLKQKLGLLKARLQTELDEKEKLQMMLAAALKQKKKRDEEAAAQPTPMDTENAAAAKVGSSFASSRACWCNTLYDGVFRWLNARRNCSCTATLCKVRRICWSNRRSCRNRPSRSSMISMGTPSRFVSSRASGPLNVLFFMAVHSQVRHKAEPDL